MNINGKEPRHGSGDAIVTAVTATTQFYPGSAIVPTEKPKEIPVAGTLFHKRDLDGRMFSLDVSHLDDLSRVRKPSAMLFMGMFRRLSNSLCLHGISKHDKPHHKTTFKDLVRIMVDADVADLAK